MPIGRQHRLRPARPFRNPIPPNQTKVQRMNLSKAAHLKKKQDKIKKKSTMAERKRVGVQGRYADVTKPEGALNIVGLFNHNRIDYNDVKKKCYFKIDNPVDVDISVIIPVRGRTNFNNILTRYLRAAFAACPELTYSITFVEHDVNKSHEPYIFAGVNYIHIPAVAEFNKCMAFNVGFLFSNNANYYLFHDTDILMSSNFFNDILKNLKKFPTALQTFTKRRLLYCDEAVTDSIISGQILTDQLDCKSPGITEPAPDLHGAPGGSILVSKDQFIATGGYDAEFFFGYSVEDRFFYDKLVRTGGINSCDNPAIECYHLNHPRMSDTNPQLFNQKKIYESFSSMPENGKRIFITMESTNFKTFLR